MDNKCPLIDKNEICWQTGNYQDGCICEFCQHKEECSGSDIKEDD